MLNFMQPDCATRGFFVYVCNSLQKQKVTKETKTGQAEVTYLLTRVILFSRFS